MVCGSPLVHYSLIILIRVVVLITEDPDVHERALAGRWQRRACRPAAQTYPSARPRPSADPDLQESILEKGRKLLVQELGRRRRSATAAIIAGLQDTHWITGFSLDHRILHLYPCVLDINREIARPG